MKKQSISTLVIVGCICILQSCATFNPCTTLNAYVSPLYSNILGESDSWMGSFGAQAGVEAYVPFKNCKLPLTAWGGINFSMQGAGWEESFDGTTYNGNTRLWYMNIPLTGRYTFASGFYGEAGIQPGILLSAKDKEGGSSYNYRDYIKPVDFSIPLGIGYNFPNNFGVGLRVIPGVSNINKGDYDNYKDHNFVIALKLNYTFPGKDL